MEEKPSIPCLPGNQIHEVEHQRALVVDSVTAAVVVVVAAAASAVYLVGSYLKGSCFVRETKTPDESFFSKDESPN
jgi:hypothetical protein